MTAKISMCIWYDHAAREAAEFYAGTFPDSRIDAVHLAPRDFRAAKKATN